MKNTLRALLASAVLLCAFAATAQAQSVKVLVFHGPPDATTTAGVNAIKDLGTAGGFGVDEAAAATDLNPANLDKYRALVFLNTAGDLLNAEQESAVQRFVEQGNGFLGIGSAAQGESGSFFDGLIGARPTAGSPTATTAKTVAVGDRVHPATRDLPALWDRSDVWYQWTARVTGTVHVVARYRTVGAPSGDATKDGTTDNDTPISWCRDYRGGRSFYTGMGRTAAAYGEADFKKHLAGALAWTSGLTRGNCKATINSNYKAKQIMSAGAESTGLTTAGESHGLTVANNGWVMYIGRGDCRTDAERGALVNLPSLGRILTHDNPNVGIGCGTVHIYDPKADTGAINSGVTLAGKLAVYGDGGQGGEKTSDADHKMEYGLLGIAAAPDFATTGHIYLQYFPTFNPNTKPAGLPVERRISKMSRPRISRFTINRTTKKLDLDSEVKIFEYDAQIYSCCHVGGGMGFDSKGNLYVTTGDTNSSQGSNGYSGNNPSAKCPIGDNSVPVSANCGTANYSYQDARRTAGNTNDYNGKMLRFHPDPTIPDGAKPTVGEGTTYTIPDAAAPNGPNLFDGTEGGGGKTKREIYAMGLRNPSRLSIDPKTDVPYTAWVGPDAGAPSVTQGPSTYENAAQITRAGNYGWPYCMGNKQAYRDRPVDANLRTDSPSGYVPGGPATGGTEGWYDCDNLRNDSPNNTGLVVFPHQTGTGADAGKVRGNNVWYSRGNPGSNNGCPSFPRPRGANAAPDYSATPTQLCPYAQDNGMTIMDGPVYRYDADAADQSKRWPAYWDGRWFLHNNGGASIKHGLLLDQSTAATGGQPIYADSLRDTLAWNGSYMDSKFGTDGALYVQTYDGFFRAGPNVGIYRYDYVGGSSTPNAAPRAVPIGDFSVRFSVGSSGGVSYKWDFGDGQSSTDANPTHKYAEAKRYTAKLTVTYGDGGTDANTIDVDVLATADEIAPTTTATFNPATPGNGGTYTRPVTITLTAADNAGGSGVDITEYRVNGGEYQIYAGPVTRSQPGDYTVDYRSVDKTGNVETAKTVTFKIAIPENCPTNLNDEFAGPTLDPKWQILRGDANYRVFDSGRLRITVRNGDMIGATATAQNVLLQPAPAGSWQATTKLDVSTLTTSGDQAGFILWQRENPNTFAKITYISKGTTQQYEWVATRNGASQISTGPSISARPTDVYLRLSSNGSGTYIAEGSVDGENWQQISSPITDLGDPSTLKVGLKVSNTQNSTTRNAGFDYFRVDCSDKIAPVTTAKLDKATPDGKLGWYSTAPKVELTANDGVGEGVDKITYKVDGGAAQTYEGPFTVDGEGEHVIEYFASDKAENVETAKTVAFRVDANAPETTGTGEIDEDKGEATVTLDVDDGEKGSGSVLTEYRVDGGPWKVYESKAEQIFDGSAASMAQWKQAGAGNFNLATDASGSYLDPVGGLGMLWYPKPYGDYKLSLQWREGQGTNGFSNGGVFVRFPNPEQNPRTDECAKVGSAATDNAWVAIYCGHELQIYDGNTGETRKTGSIYTFDNNDITQIGPAKPRGEWEDYVITAKGQHITIARNGTVIKEFDNTPGKQSDRSGDPSTTLRQFAQGYIGLQNHGGADRIQYRNIRIEDLSAGARGVVEAKPFTITGRGPHTIEARSTDAAGHQEAKKTFSFEIGSVTPPGDTGNGDNGNNNQPPIVLVPQVVSPIIPAMAQSTATATFGTITSKITRATFAKKGLAVPVTCTGAMDGTAKLTVTSAVAKRLKLSRTTLASADATCYGPHSIKVALKPSSSLAKALARKGGPKSVKLTLSVEMHVFGKAPQTLKKSITLKR
ncbi:OmpL47-type beta-barrel domain-containing protein [Solirubrobacter soli]|uniref:OmpL47-type beta-barrel domain-containing protein n=1 Tax=Solirubrobacter soli TaxID=363832 RepID=UPI00041ECD3F|nr:ThuA domain-containing protein [Solirubrobacter soli]